MQAGDIRHPTMVLLLTYVSCFVYGVIHLYQITVDVNKGLGREEFNPELEIILSVMTCGLWSLYFQWRLCEATVELQRAWGVEPKVDSTVLYIMVLGGVGPYFFQQSLNHAWEHGTPGGSGHGSHADY
ncbi:MAG: hypothetical protein ACQEVA_06035 [Myxococcota bacterium]